MNATASSPLPNPAERFFRTLYGNEFPGVLSIWSLPDKRTHFLKYPLFAARKAQELASNQDVYFGVGLRREVLAADKRGEARDVASIPGLWADIDIKGVNHVQEHLPETKEQALELAYSLTWAPTLIVFSGGGIQAYWLFREHLRFGSQRDRDHAQSLSRRFQAALIEQAERRGWKIDNTSDLARVLRVPGTFNRKHDPVPVEVIEYHPEWRYSPEDFAAIPEDVPTGRDTRAKVDPEVILGGIDFGARDNDLYSYACSLRARNVPEAEAKVLIGEAVRKCRPAFSEADALEKLERVYGKFDAGGGNQADPQPEPAAVEDSDIRQNAFYGLAGDIVKRIDPYTESDRRAILLHLLVGFGNVIGDAPHAIVGAERHPARLNAVLVGPTSSGRKTSAWRPCKEIFRRCDPDWIGDRVRTGLSTGEGIIFHLRDGSEDGKDGGVTDKRLLCIEPEFSSMLKIMGREGNSLLGVLRTAWDDGNLSTLTKNSPLKATGAHFGLIGHTTKDELLRYLDATEKGNGFANRILWVLVQRSKFLPDGEPIPDSIMGDLAGRMGEVIEWARVERCLRRDPVAAELWRNVYAQLSQERPGMSGAMLSRAEAQTLRLSLVYALLDRSVTIRVEHLRAALAVWEACEQSVLSIFGDRTGDPVADRVLEELRGREEIARDEIVNLFSRHRTARVDRALGMLLRLGRIVAEKRTTGGRPVTVYRMARKAREAR